MDTQRIFLQKHEPITFTFNQNRYDFIVNEIANKVFKGKGNFLILKIKKELISTWELLNIISNKLEIDENQIGYAGLKDKNATTTQYISIPLNKSRDYKLINSKYITVLETFQDDRKLKIGDLEANRFKITLKDVEEKDLSVLYQTISQIQKHGMPNYFGFQRFGKDCDFEKTKRIIYGEEILADKKLNRFLKFAYQSYFFNAWLIKRVELSKEKGLKKLLDIDGDIYNLNDRTIITGLLPGRDIIKAKKDARVIEEKFDDIFIHEKGYRRDAWIKPKDIKNRYFADKRWLELEFTLPKSSYATVFIENLANKNLRY
ncbi:MAG: tRNA pseudouridine(13) synthase TruD [Campylobacterota bacterium]|nr:tRNA pseudouridine(13) synthase TruD [Campylobacterota bacterium]